MASYGRRSDVLVEVDTASADYARTGPTPSATIARGVGRNSLLLPRRGAQPQAAVAGVVGVPGGERLRRLARDRVQRHPRGGGADRRLAALQVPGVGAGRAAARRKRGTARRARRA